MAGVADALPLGDAANLPSANLNTVGEGGTNGWGTPLTADEFTLGEKPKKSGDSMVRGAHPTEFSDKS